MIQRFNYLVPTQMNGIEEYFPPELQDAAFELIRRTDTRFDALESAIRNQIPVDTSLLPEQNAGASTPSTKTLATTSDVEGSELETIILNF